MDMLDLKEIGVRGVNTILHDISLSKEKSYKIKNPMGQHSIACGLNAAMQVEIEGHVGFYCGGMNKHADIKIKGHAGVGVAENMMSGSIHVSGNASDSAGATAHGGLLVIDGDASSRCGISMKGIDIIVKGSVGHMSAFMAQSGNLIILGDADEYLGDSIYEAKIYCLGKVKSLGADCIEKKMNEKEIKHLSSILKAQNIKADPKKFKRYGSARNLYNFKIDNVSSY